MSRARKLLLAFLVAFTATWFLTNRWGNQWEMPVRLALYQVFSDTMPELNVSIVGADGVPKVYMAPENGIEAGTQYNPTIVANFALDYHKKCVKKNNQACNFFHNAVQSLRDSLITDSLGSRYVFPWRQPWYPKVPAPYYSGMTSGRALEVFMLAFEMRKDSSLYYASRNLVRGYYRTVMEGGFTYKEPDGWWYEEFASPGAETPRILDGHMYAIKGLMAFQEKFPDDSAAVLIEHGLRSLKIALKEYDSPDGLFHYDKYGKVADKNYRKIILGLLQYFYCQTGDPTFDAYYEKWVKRDQLPYFFRLLRDRNLSAGALFVILTLALGVMFWFGISAIWKRGTTNTQ